MSSGDMGLGRRTHGWLSCSRRPGGLPTISCHHVDSGRYWRFPAEWPCTGSSVELAVHVGSATARGVYGPVECARRWASREAAGRQLIRVAQRQHRSQGDPHGRPHRAAVTPLDRAYLCRLRGNLGGTSTHARRDTDTPTAARPATGASRYRGLLSGIPRTLLLRFQEHHIIPRRNPTAR
jgi:hypothetical protein